MIRTINELITFKEANLDSLKEDSYKMQQRMANSHDINEIAQQIQDTKRAISLLNGAKNLSKELPGNSDSKDIESVKDHLQEMQDDLLENRNGQNKSETLENIEKDLQVFDNIIENDLLGDEPKQEPSIDVEDTTNTSDFGDF